MSNENNAKNNKKIKLILFNQDDFEIREIKDINEIKHKDNENVIIWIPINKNSIIQEIARKYGIHPIISETIIDKTSPPKFEGTEDYIFLLMKELKFAETKNAYKLHFEQFALILFKDKLLVFSNNSNIIDHIAERIEQNLDNLRNASLDYVMYKILSNIINTYINYLNHLQELFEHFEEELLKELNSENILKLTKLKRELIGLKKIIWPTKESILAIERFNSNLIKRSTKFYFRDLIDDLSLLYSSVEGLRDYINSVQDITLSMINNQMNEVMKILTVMSTIFIPLTFITGIYGMNFKFMPELYWRYGYYLILFIMFIIGISMLVYFKKKKWI